jgi:Fic-DOC domain mobile mystery protein B
MVANFSFKDRDGQTPLPEELLKGLIPKHIQNMGELDEYEEANIVEGLAWLEKCNEDCLNYEFWRKLHKKLFGNVWSWAGEVRKHEINNPYFLDPHQIWPAFKQLEGDLKFWLEKRQIPFQEIAARFHEKIETIHPYPNGNGRFGRILVEYFCKRENEKIPTWGESLKADPKLRRKNYVAALDHARKNGDYSLLVQFMFL